MGKIKSAQTDSLFVFSPGSGNAGNYFIYNIGSAYIISYLQLHGYSASQFIYRDFINLDNCVRKILLYGARIVGFTAFNSNFLTSAILAEKIRNASPETLIVFGGPVATNYAEFILGRYPFIDACFRNESEETFLQFLNLLSDNSFELERTDLKQVKGISYRIGNKICCNPDSNILVENSSFADSLDKYASPYLNGIIPASDAFETGILTARGCNQNCIYCNCAVLSKRRFTTHSVDRVISEVDFISGYANRKEVLNFYDDAFTLIPQRAKTICKAIIENRIKINLSCITRCDCIDEELLDLMKEAGFLSIGFSLESANPRTLRIIGKVHKAEDEPSDQMEAEVKFIEKLGEMSAYAKKIGIKQVFSSIMVGLPRESLKEANRTIETIDNYEDIDFFSHNILTIFKGTPLYSKYQKYGYGIQLIDDNPIFSRTIYPDDTVDKVKISSKSQINEIQKTNDLNALKVLSWAPEKNNSEGWFNNIVLFSDKTESEFVTWLKAILSINGTIIQVYSDEEALFDNFRRNHETFIRYGSPSLNLRNYYLKKINGSLQLCSYLPHLMRDGRETSISICSFDFVKSNLTNPAIDFTKVICRESGSDDSILAFDFFSGLKSEKSLFDYLVNRKPFPYFANLCKWTKNLSNCTKRDTLFINDKAEIRFCWFGITVGRTGQSYSEIVGNFETHRNAVSDQRKCKMCVAHPHCIKCPDPFPISGEEYCKRQKMNDISDVTEGVMNFDVFKIYV
jgi:radical SAM superfamily enzyme YgiQ (UPF0313 family)